MKPDLYFLFESTKVNSYHSSNYLFTEPVDVVIAKQPDDIEPAMKKIEEYSKKYYLAGWVSYETGYYFENYFLEKNIEKNISFPLIYFGVFKNYSHLNNYQYDKDAAYKLYDLKLNIAKQKYIENITKIKNYLSNGDTYQVNYTIKYKFDIEGDKLSFYNVLKNNQNVSYSAFFKFDDEYIISLSPELFFDLNNNIITLKPMKGTSHRGKNILEDNNILKNFIQNEKEQAENLMIVDLLRNDIGRISIPGSVKVKKLFEIEKYNTLFQMTSTINSILKEELSYKDIFKSIFPCGSVTGAPKIRTMEIINELENESRNVYCGAIGIIFPDNRAIFNVPIRTIYINDKNQGEMGIGSGVTIDSLPEKEYDECILKGDFLTRKYKQFKLIETLLFENDYFLIDMHLNRLKDSASYFEFKFDINKITNLLYFEKKNLDKNKKYKIRILLNKNGDIEFEPHYYYIDDNDKFIKVSDIIMNSNDVFLYHKTTNRSLYNEELNKAKLKGYYDIVFLNEKNELTEGAFNNIVLRFNKYFYTPPVDSGLLNGVYREYLFNNNKIYEKILYYEDLINADEIFLCNSVRKLQKVKLSKEKLYKNKTKKN